MNEKEKRDLMLKAAVQFKGAWPDVREDQDCLIISKQHSEIRASMINSSEIDEDLDKERFDFICTRTEYEAFIESLFEGAPDDAEFYLHRESGYVFWKSVVGGYLHWNKATQEWDDQVCSLSQVESELIKRPRNQEKSELSGEWLPPVGSKCEIQTDDLSDFYQVTIQAYSNDGKVVFVYDDNCEYDYFFIDDTTFRPLKTEPKNWTPKAGEPCEFDVGGGDWVYALPLFVGKTIVVFENDHGEECRATSVDRFRPAQTEAEKEFEFLMSRIADDFGHLYDIDVIGDFATDLILAGWRPQKVAE